MGKSKESKSTAVVLPKNNSLWWLTSLRVENTKEIFGSNQNFGEHEGLICQMPCIVCSPAKDVFDFSCMN